MDLSINSDIVYGVLLMWSMQPLLASSLSILGPKYPPTQGRVWPQPFLQRNLGHYITVDVTKFILKGRHGECELMKKAKNRFDANLKILKDITKKYGKKEVVVYDDVDDEYDHPMLYDDYLPDVNIFIQINFGGKCEIASNTEMDESYTIYVPIDERTWIIQGHDVWGALRGFETLSQLFYVTPDFKHVQINTTSIEDTPNYPYRGYMLDTSRHYVSVNNILKTLDAMEMNKLNVFHWHIYDDHSFPYVSRHFPELSEYGAYHHSMVYNETVVQKVVEYAYDRGIRVILEFDMPGHTASIGVSHPEIITQCKRGPFSHPMNPVKKETYKLLKGLLSEAQALIPNKYFHLGGDEVYADCWKDDPHVQRYMEIYHITNITKIFNLFYTKMLSLLQDGTIPIFWQDAFEQGVHLPNNSIIQVWNDQSRLVDLIKAGYRGILSANYYLNFVANQNDFDSFYIDPRTQADLKDRTLSQNILGGTACMWGENVDDTNALSRSWPRASAMAETLWSFTDGKMSSDTYNRIEEHACRMRRRGVPAEPPKGPGFCVV